MSFTLMQVWHDGSLWAEAEVDTENEDSVLIAMHIFKDVLDDIEQGETFSVTVERL